MKNRCYIIFIGCLSFLLSCEQIETESPAADTSAVQQQYSSPEDPDHLIVVGKKLENPYTVDIMQEAFQRLKADKRSAFFGARAEELEVEVTDYYVRFLPEDDYQVGLLSLEDSLILSDFPLDYEIEEGVAGAYHDPSLPKDQITWQYTVVPKDYRFRNIPYEILDELFLQEEGEEPASGNRLKRQLDSPLWTALENEAFRLTGNEEYIEEFPEGMASARSSWYPSGRILYEDNVTNETVPLVGVKVMIKRWFKLKDAITNSQGNFYSGSFKSKKVKIGIKWERDDWDIRSGSYGQAWYTYETVNKGNTWNKTIRKSGTPLNWIYASVHRGAEEYFSNHWKYGIRKPYSKYFFTRRLHIGVKDKSGRSHYFKFNEKIWSAPVVIYANYTDGSVKDSRDLFATAVHELAHVSHWEIGYTTGQYVIDALISDPKLPESWAVGVEHTITNDVYRDRGSKYDYPYRFNRQKRTLVEIQGDEGYTPIVIDMIDDVNQSKNGSEYPNDRVNGYTLGQLEVALPESLGSWWNWRSRIRKQYDNPTENTELDYLFQNYD